MKGRSVLLFKSAVACLHMVKVTHPRNRGCIRDKKGRLEPGQPLCTTVNEFGILQEDHMLIL